MSDFTDFLDTVRAWDLRPDRPDALVTSFVRMAETNLSQQLRVSEMVVNTDAICMNNRVALPLDWNEAELVRFQNGKPLEFKSNTDFYNETHKPRNWYTILGREIEFSAPIDETEGLAVQMSYYQYIPTFNDGATWVFNKYYNVYLTSCLVAAAFFAQEFDRATNTSQVVSGLIQTANDNYNRSKSSGSLLKIARPRRIG